MINAFGLLGECGCNFFLDSLAGVSNRNSKQQTFGVSKIVGAGLQDLLINKLGKDQYKISDSQLIVVTTRLKKKNTFLCFTGFDLLFSSESYCHLFTS